MKFKNYLYCAILIVCISLISGCNAWSLIPKYGRVYQKGEISICGRIPYKSRDAKFHSIYFGSVDKPMESIPDIQVELKSGGFINLSDIDIDYLSNNAKRISRYYIDLDNMMLLGKTWAHDVNIYILDPYTVMHSKSNGLVGFEGYFREGKKLKSKGKVYVFPLVLSELTEIFGEPDKVYKRLTPL